MNLRKFTRIAASVLLTLLFCLMSANPPDALADSVLADSSKSTASIPLFNTLGDFHYPISTQSELTQQYFNQGMTLAYGFNHAEAARSFQAGIQHDASCAMCYWGLAYVLGPNINAPMGLDAVPTAWDAMQQAQALSPQASPKEQALIEALATRYVEDPDTTRDALDQAYAQAMQEVHQQYPNDLDIAVLYAEALMDTMPWDYWDEEGNPGPNTERLLSTLESVMAKDPEHIGALHLYIHAVEKEHPELAETAADTLGSLVPGAGHLVHMPSHIYIRIGRYPDAVVANQKAIAADHQYLQDTHVASNIYTLAYMPHNYHFEWFAALMSGQRELALDAAKHTAQVDKTMWQEPDFAGALQHYYSVPLFTLVRFERWEAILATPAPEENLKYPMGIWHYAQGMALAAQGNTVQAREHLAMLQPLINDPILIEQKIWGLNATNDIIHIAALVLAGEIAQADGNSEDAIAQLQQAVEVEKQLVYNEPPDWYSPTQNLLGQVLLKAGHYEAAETTFRSDLEAYPQNGWSLYGLAESLQAQGKVSAAATIRRQYEAVWKDADTPLIMSSSSEVGDVLTDLC